MRRIAKFAALVALAGAGTVMAVPAQAAPNAHADFGQHVRMCAQMGMFSGTHNPGVMHQGKSGWNPDAGNMCQMTMP